jgi:hypothetical protein
MTVSLYICFVSVLSYLQRHSSFGGSVANLLCSCKILKPHPSALQGVTAMSLVNPQAFVNSPLPADGQSCLLVLLPPTTGFRSLGQANSKLDAGPCSTCAPKTTFPQG